MAKFNQKIMTKPNRRPRRGHLPGWAGLFAGPDVGAVPAGGDQHGRRADLLRVAPATATTATASSSAPSPSRDPKWTARFLRLAARRAPTCAPPRWSAPPRPSRARLAAGLATAPAATAGSRRRCCSAPTSRASSSPTGPSRYGRACPSRSSAASPTRPRRLYTERTPAQVRHRDATRFRFADVLDLTHPAPARRRGRATCSRTRSTAGTTGTPRCPRRCAMLRAPTRLLRAAVAERRRAVLPTRRRARARPA